MVAFDHMLFMYDINDFDVKVNLIIQNEIQLYELTYSFTFRDNPYVMTNRVEKRKIAGDITLDLMMKKDIINIFNNHLNASKIFGTIDFDDYEFPKIDNITDIDEVL